MCGADHADHDDKDYHCEEVYDDDHCEGVYDDDHGDDRGEDVYDDDHGDDVYEDHLVRCCPPSPRLTHSEQMFPLWPEST